MVHFKRLSLAVLLAVLSASRVDAAPWPASSKHSTHHVRHIGHNLKVEAFHPKSIYETYGNSLELPPPFGTASIDNKTVSFVSLQMNIGSSNKFGYVKQIYDGIPFINAIANVAFKDNKAVAFGQSFVNTENTAASKPTVDVNSVIPKIEDSLQGKRNGIEPSLGYLALQDEKVALAHVFQVQNEKAGTWYEAYADAHSGELLSVTDFVAKATYKVLPVWKYTLYDGAETLVDPQNTASSPQGWHSGGTVVTA
ncbi:hypothetical protein L218DRAFT_945793 [Marasmius fiardii PR-910]|nr:hypothetical protein L218DRAFT_945793 [Marasmius fiardii PR-910]